MDPDHPPTDFISPGPDHPRTVQYTDSECEKGRSCRIFLGLPNGGTTATAQPISASCQRPGDPPRRFSVEQAEDSTPCRGTSSRLHPTPSHSQPQCSDRQDLPSSGEGARVPGKSPTCVPYTWGLWSRKINFQLIS